MALRVPIDPDAPPWFTTTTFCPSAFSISAAVTRLTWSVDPPAAQGTISVIGFSGFPGEFCADAAPVSASTAAVAMVMMRGIVVLPIDLFLLLTAELLVG